MIVTINKYYCFFIHVWQMLKAQLQILLVLHDLYSAREDGDRIPFKTPKCLRPLKCKNHVSWDKMLMDIWIIRQNTCHEPDEIRNIWQESLSSSLKMERQEESTQRFLNITDEVTLSKKYEEHQTIPCIHINSPPNKSSKWRVTRNSTKNCNIFPSPSLLT